MVVFVHVYMYILKCDSTGNHVFYWYKEEKKHFSPSDDSECWFLSGYIPTINHFERKIFARCTFHRQSKPKNNDGQSAIITVVIVSRNHCILVTVRHLERFWSRRLNCERLSLWSLGSGVHVLGSQKLELIQYESWYDHILFINC